MSREGPVPCRLSLKQLTDWDSKNIKQPSYRKYSVTFTYLVGFTYDLASLKFLLQAKKKVFKKICNAMQKSEL